jgi:hypothetical protein
MFRTERDADMNRETVFDAANHACYAIVKNTAVHNLADKTVAFNVSGNHLIAPDGRPAYYFDTTREDELVAFIRERSPSNEGLVKQFKSAFFFGLPEAQTIIASLGD